MFFCVYLNNIQISYRNVTKKFDIQPRVVTNKYHSKPQTPGQYTEVILISLILILYFHNSCAVVSLHKLISSVDVTHFFTCQFQL